MVSKLKYITTISEKLKSEIFLLLNFPKSGNDFRAWNLQRIHRVHYINFNTKFVHVVCKCNGFKSIVFFIYSTKESSLVQNSLSQACIRLVKGYPSISKPSFQQACEQLVKGLSQACNSLLLLVALISLRGFAIHIL